MKGDREYLSHILDAIGDIEGYASAGREAFLCETMRQDAAIRKLEVIGEAVRHLSDAAKALAPEIPWRAIAGIRDRLTHGYFGVDLNLVWAVVQDDVPELRAAIVRIAAQLPPAAGS